MKGFSLVWRKENILLFIYLELSFSNIRDLAQFAIPTWILLCTFNVYRVWNDFWQISQLCDRSPEKLNKKVSLSLQHIYRIVVLKVKCQIPVCTIMCLFKARLKVNLKIYFYCLPPMYQLYQIFKIILLTHFAQALNK